MPNHQQPTYKKTMNNTIKHSPGPWRTGGTVIRSSEGFGIADTDPLQNGATDQNKANAQLIAAAPALLEALQETLRVLVTPQGFPDKNKGRTQEQQDAFDQSRQAIAQATGEQP
jgi:hypothetical protein